jgi:hypothetical protein
MSDRPSGLPLAEEIMKRLRDDLGYSKQGAEAIIAELATCRDEVKKAFAAWWVDGRLDTLEVEGWTAQKISERFGCLPPAAILNLDWLLTEPIAARAALQRGVDRIVPEKAWTKPPELN